VEKIKLLVHFWLKLYVCQSGNFDLIHYLIRTFAADEDHEDHLDKILNYKVGSIPSLLKTFLTFYP